MHDIQIQKPSKKLATFISGRKHADYYPGHEQYFQTDLVHVCENHTESELDSAEPTAEIQHSDSLVHSCGSFEFYTRLL